MTPEQRATADAYAQVFGATPAVQRVLDDLTVTANAMADPLTRAGATNLLLHILLKRSATRRERAKDPRRAKETS